MKRQKRIAVAAERSSAYGRSFIRGVAEVAEQHTEWNLVLIDPKQATARASGVFDGWICRVADDPVYCMFSTPRLSSIDPDAAAIGRTAATTMDEMLSDRKTAANPPDIVVPPIGVVERASTDTYPDAPPWFAEALTHRLARAQRQERIAAP